MNEEKYFRVSDLRKICDDSRDWGVPTFTADDLRGHGHWENKQIGEDISPYDAPYTIARCSVCRGKVFVFAEHYIVNYPYCPLCGTKMDEVEDEC